MAGARSRARGGFERRLSGAGAWLLPVGLWLAAMLFLRADLGKWNDDYMFFGQLEPASGRIRSLFLDRPLHFWRPVYRLVATPIIVALFDHDRVLHLIAAALHALVCLGLYGLLRRLGIGAAAAGIAAMLMLVHPAHSEVPLWPTCTFTGVATGLTLVMCAVYVWWLERGCMGVLDKRRAAASGAALAAMAALGFISAASNEQPAAMVAALPVLGAGMVMLGRERASGGARQTLARELTVAALPVAAAGIGVGVDVAVQMLRFPAPAGEGMGCAIPVPALPGRVVEVGRQVAGGWMLRGVKSDAWRLGVDCLRGDALGAAAVGVMIVVGGAAWVLWLRGGRATEPVHGDGAGAARRRLIVAAFGLAWFAACWLPIVRIVYPARWTRLSYAPDIGLMIALAAAIDLALGVRVLRTGRRWRAGAAAVPVLAGLAVLMIGVQRAYQLRWRADEDQARQLTALVPNPPARAVFVAVRAADPLPGLEPRAFGGRFQSPILSGWSGGWWLCRAYRRDDVFFSIARPETERPALGAVRADDPVRFPRGRALPLNPMAPPYAEYECQGASVLWKLIVPFEVDSAGRVSVYSRVVVEWAGGESEGFALPATGPGGRAGKALRVREAPDGVR